MRSTLFRLLVLALILSFVLSPLSASLTLAGPSAQTNPANDTISTSAPVIDDFPDDSGSARYIIQLSDLPLATYTGGVAGLSATSPTATGDRKLNTRSAASQAYLNYLDAQQTQFVTAAGGLLGRPIQPIFSYQHAYNGVVLSLTPAEARQIAQVKGVELVFRDRDEELLTDAGPSFLGAPSIWGGDFTSMAYTSQLSGANEVPPNASAATGSAEITYNMTTGLLSWSISHNVASPTAAHFHNAPAGVNGPAVITLDHTQNPIVGSVTLTEAQQGFLVNSTLYINIHTAAFPAGEIRGQVVPQGSLGEGIIVGILDTGINSDHPSFAQVGGDGYIHTNPFGTGNYVGYCIANPGFCNNKLIGAWSFVTEAMTPEDSDGHGSHTASTVAGNIIKDADMIAPTATYTFPFISGVAPHANIIAYDVCTTSCPVVATTAAVDQAVIDGVDVLNYSISGGTNPYVEPTIQAFLNANTAGILTAASAGNSGPTVSSVNHQEPWNLTVAASTHNRAIRNSLVNLTSSSGPLADILGEGPTSGYGPAPIVYAGAAPFNNALCNPFPAGTFTGQIVVCDRGTIGRVAKGQNVLAAGGGGMILVNDLPSAASLSADTHVLPAVHISYALGLDLKTWLASGSNHQGAITGGTVDNNGASDNMASFSSRGPATTMVATIKPDITAPGLNILAAYNTTGNPPPPEFNIISGTSMSSPHAAGSAALLRALYPSWTPAEVKSALMMTSISTINKEDNTTPGDAFDFGSGRIDIAAAANTGFVLDITLAEYTAANPAISGDPKILNLPSLANPNCLNICTWTRTLRSVLSTSQEYTASVTAPAGLSGTVSPASFTLAPGGTQEIVISLDVTGSTSSAWTFAAVQIDPDSPGVSPARMPVAVMPFVELNPTIQVDPLTISTTVPYNGQTTLPLEITNTGIGSLLWNIEQSPGAASAPDLDLPVGADRASQNGLSEGGPAPASILPQANPMIFSGFSENFDNISLLPGLGWALINNSSPAGSNTWFQGNTTVFSAHEGATNAYIAANFNSTSGSGTISNWLITPNILLKNDDSFSFWTRTTAGSTWPDRLEVRLSSSGASIDVGSTATSEGDFDTLLMSINPTLTSGGYPDSWTRYNVTLSGLAQPTSGRLAFRYFVTNGGPSGSNSNYIGIDTVRFTAAPENQLYTNGPLVNSFGTGPGGSDLSILQTSLGMTIFGYGHQFALGNRIADDFTVSTPGGWTVDQFLFYPYQTSSTLSSTITGVYYQIWDGPPDLPESSVIYGDLTNNRLESSEWTNIYRVTESTLSSTARPIMEVVAQAGLHLAEGTYWLDWTVDGSLTSGPWAPPVTISGEATTGDAIQFLTDSWGPALDNDFPQGLPFKVFGTTVCDNLADIPWLSVSPSSGETLTGATDQVEVSLDAAGLDAGNYSAYLCVFSNDVQNPQVAVPVEITVLDPVAPTASFTAPDNVFAGDPVDFTNTTTGTEPIDYTWDFGDGSATSSDPNPQHIFTTPASTPLSSPQKTWSTAACLKKPSW
jgi:subtilisin family serine protease